MILASAQSLVLVDIGVERNDEPNTSRGTKMLATKYVLCARDGQISIDPDSDYLGAVRGGQPLKAFSYSPDPFPISVPVVKVRILNNSSGQIVVNRVVLAVERSCPVVEPLLLVVNHCRPGRCILLVNEGAGKSGPCKLRYKLLPITDSNEPDFADLRHEVTTDGFDRSWLADLSAGLAAEGLDLQAFDALKSAGAVISAKGSWTYIQSGELIWSAEREERIRQLCGRYFQFPEARVFGCLERRDDSTTTERIFFESSVTFVERTGYFPLSAKPQEWDLTLSAEGEKYEVAIPADPIVKSGESAELKVSVGAKRPSQHRMSVQVIYNHDRVASSCPLNVRIFVPRSSYDDQTWEWLYRN